MKKIIVTGNSPRTTTEADIPDDVLAALFVDLMTNLIIDEIDRMEREQEQQSNAPQPKGKLKKRYPGVKKRQ